MKKIIVLFISLLLCSSAWATKYESGNTDATPTVLYGKYGTTLVPMKVAVDGSIYTSGGTGAASGWTTDSSTKTTTSYNVGIGSATPRGALDVGSGSIYGNGSNITGITGVLSSLTANKVPKASSATSEVDGSIYDYNGMVGIGTTSNYTNTKLDVRDNFDYVTSAVNFGTILYSKNTGSAAVGSGGHGGGGLLWAEDTGIGAMTMYGGEGRVDGHSNSGGIIYDGILGKGRFQDSVVGNTTVFSGYAIGVQGAPEITNYDGSARNTQGTAMAFYAPGVVGGADKYGLYIAVDKNFLQGNTGIGYSAPSAQLDVGGFNPSHGTLPANSVGVSGSIEVDTNIYGDGNLYIASNIGIGTVNPTNLLEIEKDSLGTTQTSIINLQNRTSGSIQVPPSISFLGNLYTGSTNFPIEWRFGGSNVDTIGGRYDFRVLIPSISSDNTILSMGWDGSKYFNGYTEFENVTNFVGNTGIGTTAPGYRFEIGTGNASSGPTLTAASATVIKGQLDVDSTLYNPGITVTSGNYVCFNSTTKAFYVKSTCP